MKNLTTITNQFTVTKKFTVTNFDEKFTFNAGDILRVVLLANENYASCTRLSDKQHAYVAYSKLWSNAERYNALLVEAVQEDTRDYTAELIEAYKAKHNTYILPVLLEYRIKVISNESEFYAFAEKHGLTDYIELYDADAFFDVFK